MPQTGQPLFLARRSYRRRRMMDAVRMLPVLGMVLFMLPSLWLPGETPRPDTGRGGLYIFAVWAGLVVGLAFAGVMLMTRFWGRVIRKVGPRLDQPPSRSSNRQ